MHSRTPLFVGITPQRNSLLLSSFARGHASIQARFPDTPMSAEAIRVYLCDHEGPVNLAVDTALIDFALRWARTTFGTTAVVPSVPEAQAWMLARYASRAL